MTRSSFLRSSVVLALVAALALPALAKDDALSLVPAKAATVGMVKLSEMRTSPLSSMLFQQTDKMSSDGEAEKFLNEAGLSLTKDVDTLVVATTPREALGAEADVLVIAEGRFNVEALKNAMLNRGAKQANGYLVLADDDSADGERGAIAFLSKSMVIGGQESSVIAALAARAAGGTGFRTRGALGLDLGRIDPNATAWALIDVTRASRLAKGGTVHTGNSSQGQAVAAAMKNVSTMALWAKDRGDQLELGAFGLCNDAETLQLLEDTVRGGLSALRLAVKDKAPDMVNVLRGFDVKRTSDAIEIGGSIPADVLRQLMAKKVANR